MKFSDHPEHYPQHEVMLAQGVSNFTLTNTSGTRLESANLMLRLMARKFYGIMTFSLRLAVSILNLFRVPAADNSNISKSACLRSCTTGFCFPLWLLKVRFQMTTPVATLLLTETLTRTGTLRANKSAKPPNGVPWEPAQRSVSPTHWLSFFLVPVLTSQNLI